MTVGRNIFAAVCIILGLASIGFCQLTDGVYDEIGPITKLEGKPSSESPEPRDGVKTLTIPAASFSNTFEMSNQQPGRILFRPSAGFFTADRSTGAYAKEGFQLEKSGLKIINVRLHARDNSNGGVLVQAYGIEKGTFNTTNLATFAIAQDFRTAAGAG